MASGFGLRRNEARMLVADFGSNAHAPMEDERGLVCIDGTAVADGRKVFVLCYLQARDPDLASTPFFAAFSAEAAGLTDLGPASGTRFPGGPDPAETR